jgi:hypothetical protein
VHGAHHRIFTNAKEQAVADRISANWLLPGRLFTDTALIKIKTEALLERSKDIEPAWTFSAPPVFFLVSNTEIFSPRRAHIRCNLSMTENDKINCLILDCASVHYQEELKHSAAELGLNLLFIPPGLMDKFQPLDLFVFEEQLPPDVPSPYDRVRHDEQAGRSQISSPRMGIGQFRSPR